jgi:hypothetical protein
MRIEAAVGEKINEAKKPVTASLDALFRDYDVTFGEAGELFLNGQRLMDLSPKDRQAFAQKYDAIYTQMYQAGFEAQIQYAAAQNNNPAFIQFARDVYKDAYEKLAQLDESANFQQIINEAHNKLTAQNPYYRDPQGDFGSALLSETKITGIGATLPPAEE